MTMIKKGFGYKYRLHYLLRQLTYDDYTIAMKWFPGKLGITAETWKKWIYIPHDGKREIPSSALVVMSIFFGCTANDMLEKPIQPDQIITSFKEFKEDLKVQ